MDRVRTGLCHICGGDKSYSAVVFTGSGTTALEATLSSVVPLDGKVLILDNGHYGERLFKIASTHCISSSRLTFGWGNPIDLQRVDSALAGDAAITHVAMVHHETSTGMLNMASKVGELVATRGRQFILDAISSLGGEALNIHEGAIDWCVGTSNKCIEGFPGVSFVCAPRSRLEALEAIRPRTFSLNLYAHYIAQEITQVPLFTPAVQTLYALECALDLLIAESVPQRALRYRTLANHLRSGMSRLGVRFLLPPEHQSNSITALYLPPQVTYTELHDRLKAEGFVIYASQQALQRDTFRLANMGQITLEDIGRFLEAVERVI